MGSAYVADPLLEIECFDSRVRATLYASFGQTDGRKECLSMGPSVVCWSVARSCVTDRSLNVENIRENQHNTVNILIFIVPWNVFNISKKCLGFYYSNGNL